MWVEGEWIFLSRRSSLKGFYLVFGFVHSRYDQCSYLYMRSFAAQIMKSFTVFRSPPQFSVGLFRKTFQVDIEGIDPGEDPVKYIREERIRSLPRRFSSPFFCLDRNIPYVFISYHRLVVRGATLMLPLSRSSPARRAAPEGERTLSLHPPLKQPRSNGSGKRGSPCCSRRCRRRGSCFRVKSRQRFFFDRVQCDRCKFAVIN